MKLKAQSKSHSFNKKDARAFKAVVAAIEECLAKPPYDYQRIVICSSTRPGLAQALALCSGAELTEIASLADWKHKPSVLVIEVAGNCDAEALESIVFLINQTPRVVALVASGRSVAHWQDRHRKILAQIRRRTHVTVEFEI